MQRVFKGKKVSLNVFYLHLQVKLKILRIVCVVHSLFCILSYLVEFFEIFRRDHIIRIEIQNMKKEISKLVLLEVCKEIASGLYRLDVCNVIAKSPMNPRSWKKGKILGN